jgi:hypothetical protein
MAAVVTVVDFACEPLIAAQARHHSAALEDGVGAAAEVFPERDFDSDRFDTLNFQGRE